MNRRFAKASFPYDALAYRGVKRFAQDSQPHAQRCQCKACKQYKAVISRLNPSRLVTPEDGPTYVANAQVRTPEDVTASKSRLTWKDKNRPYVLANGNRSSSPWRGGVYTQVRTTPDYTVLPDGTIKVNAPAPAPAPAIAPVQHKRDNRTAREKRYAQRMARYNARNAKQIVNTSCDLRVMPMGMSHKRNGQVILSNNRIESNGTCTVVVQLTNMAEKLGTGIARNNVSTPLVVPENSSSTL